MLPDLRLVIIATLSTFLVSGAAGLYASFRLTQDPLTVRPETHASGDESPMTRISVNWPMPEPDRDAALRSLNALEKSAEAAQPVKSEPAQTTSQASEATLPEPPTGSIFDYKNSGTGDTDAKTAARPQPSAVDTIPARTTPTVRARKKRAERNRVQHRRVVVQRDIFGNPTLNDATSGAVGTPGYATPQTRAQQDTPAPFFFFSGNHPGS